MDASVFRPGFRLSASDVVVLTAGAVGSWILGMKDRGLGLMVGFVVLQFFLFCNVFRISRAPELIWAAGFIAMGASTQLTGFPGWTATFSLGFGFGSILIWRETRTEGYHGIGWRKWNPGLVTWWESRHRVADGKQVKPRSNNSL